MYDRSWGFGWKFKCSSRKDPAVRAPFGMLSAAGFIQQDFESMARQDLYGGPEEIQATIHDCKSP